MNKPQRLPRASSSHVIAVAHLAALWLLMLALGGLLSGCNAIKPYRLVGKNGYTYEKRPADYPDYWPQQLKVPSDSLIARCSFPKVGEFNATALEAMLNMPFAQAKTLLNGMTDNMDGFTTTVGEDSATKFSFVLEKQTATENIAAYVTLESGTVCLASPIRNPQDYTRCEIIYME